MVWGGHCSFMFPPRWGQLGKEVVQGVTFNEQWLAGVRKCQSVCSDKIRSVVLPPLYIYFTFSRFCQKVDIWICRPFAVTVFYSIEEMWRLKYMLEMLHFFCFFLLHKTVHTVNFRPLQTKSSGNVSNEIFDFMWHFLKLTKIINKYNVPSHTSHYLSFGRIWLTFHVNGKIHISLCEYNI